MSTTEPILPKPETTLVPQGLALMAAAMLIVPAMDVLSKLLSQHINGAQVAQVRFGLQALLLMPFIIRTRGLTGLLPRNLWLNVVRALLVAAAVSIFFTALKWMPVPDAISVFFVEPLILTLLSAWLLKEQVGWRRRLAVGAGFIGALVVIQPSYEVFGLVSLLPLATATLFAFYLLLTKTLTASEDPLTMQFFAGLVGFLALSAVTGSGTLAGITILSLAWPTPEQWLILCVIGVIATICHLMIVLAFQRAPAAVLAPFQYLEIVSATILSYFVFQDVPGGLKWLGIAIIVGSGLYVWWRERQVTA